MVVILKTTDWFHFYQSLITLLRIYVAMQYDYVTLCLMLVIRMPHYALSIKLQSDITAYVQRHQYHCRRQHHNGLVHGFFCRFR